MFPRSFACLRTAAFAALLLAPPLHAQRSAVRSFDVASGLPSMRVSSITEDSSGFLWVTTVEGLARFDGTRFDVFGTVDGLPRAFPNEVREDRRGRIWVALNGDGIARLLDEADAPAPSAFRSFRLGEDRAANTVNALYFDAENRIWVATEAGLARCQERLDGALAIELLPDSVKCLRPQAACQTPDGTIWFAGETGLARVSGGAVELLALAEPSRRPEYLCATPGAPGHLLLGDDKALWDLDCENGRWTRVPFEIATNQGVRALLRDSGGDTWVGTTAGLVRLQGGEQLLYTTEQGLPDNSIRCAFEDRGGRLWFGTWVGGLAELGRGDLVSWTRSTEMPNPDMTAVQVASDGRVIASTSNDGLFELDGDGARRLGAELSPRFDRVWQRYCELPGLGWMIATDEGAYFAPGEALDLARARRLGPEDGFPAAYPILLNRGCAPHEALLTDNAGRLVRASAGQDGSLGFVDLLTPEERRSFDSGALNDAMRNIACAPDGTLWFTSRYVLARIVGGRLETLPAGGGLPSTEVRDLAFDSRGRLWVALRHDGVSRCDDPGAGEPAWTHFEALAGKSTFTLAGNNAGHMFVGTWSGVYELDPEGRLLRHFTASGGLASDIVNFIATDREDRVWIATSAGVTRLDAGAGRTSAPAPRTWISRIEVDGEPVAIPRRLARTVGPLELSASHESLLVEFCAPWLSTDEPLAFQLQLPGSEMKWSKPQSERHVRFARLAPGDHRLLVRSLLESSQAAGEPALLEFTVPPPLWRRPWFVALGLFAVMGALFAWHRVELRQALALERVRSQIALDLHDDFGADLTQVAILAELARRDGDGGREPLEKVAALARNMRESLADIVWSVDPRRDRVADLAVRLRQVGNQLVEAGGLEFALQVDSDRALEALPLAPDERRGLYLIVKESLHNAVKHARAGHIEVKLLVRGSRLSAEVKDDGVGFDPAAAHGGHGLRSLRQRAAALGAELEVRSERAQGTTVALALRLRGPA